MFEESYDDNVGYFSLKILIFVRERILTWNWMETVGLENETECAPIRKSA